eukprot:GDKK01011599.1.p1 GENE.GDKK01011599.1~~GDKK01011599.1.p1  ORF type:complete len:128 (+),score=18.46 GDKK01011599.1:1-384(+)
MGLDNMSFTLVNDLPGDSPFSSTILLSGGSFAVDLLPGERFMFHPDSTNFVASIVLLNDDGSKLCFSSNHQIEIATLSSFEPCVTAKQQQESETISVIQDPRSKPTLSGPSKPFPPPSPSNFQYFSM